MKILLICTVLFFIILYIDMKTYSKKYNEEENERMEKEDELLKYLTDKYDLIIGSIIDESIEEVKKENITTEEEITNELHEKIFIKLSSILIREEESILKLLDDDIIKLYVSSKILYIDVTQISDEIKIAQYNKNKNDNINIATEKVDNKTKTDNSVMDITDELNNIFFND